MLTIVHVTHEAVHKIGGIGSVLEGLITAEAYRKGVGRTILLGPLFSRDGGADGRLGADGEVLYSSIDGRRDHAYAPALAEVEARYGCGLVYGRRWIRSPDGASEANPEVLLVDVHSMQPGPLNLLKFRLHEAFGIESSRYEGVWDYEQYVRLAAPALDALRALAVHESDGGCVVVAHEYMGLPTALAALLEPQRGVRAVFHAHEVAPVRRIIEQHPGHDVMFYNVMTRARREGRYLEDVFGSQRDYYKHALVAASRHCDGILAVGDRVVDEFRFMGPSFDSAEIALVYNGIPAHPITIEQSTASREKLRRYCRNLLGYAPDHIFTHVTRLVTSKGLWRDLTVMETVEEAFRREGRTGVLFVLSTEIGGPRRREDVLHMERWWKWPVAHREVRPDLTDGEAAFYAAVQELNARARNCKVIYINQFGFDRATCGERMPADMEFWDIRKGSDAEFGQSVYEPFGIAMVEALAYGCVCVINRVCGCLGFVRRVAGEVPARNIVAADYTALSGEEPDLRQLLAMTREEREQHDARIARDVAGRLLAVLPRTPGEAAAARSSGYEIARQMSWEVVAGEQFLPAIERATKYAGPGVRRKG